jgi:hypothetical protein
MHRQITNWLVAGTLLLFSSPELQAQFTVADTQPQPECCPSIAVEPSVCGGVGPNLRIQQEFGDGIGWQNGFTRLDGFVPVFQMPRQSVLFVDLRGVVFDDTRLWQFDGGAGYRWYWSDLDRIIGLNGFYDFRDTGKSSFHQLGLGVELLGDRWDFRSNLYFPVGPQHHLIAQAGGTAVQFHEFNIVLGNQTQLYEAAMRGFDLEVGRSVPLLERFDPRAYLGYYRYDAEGGKPANGIRARLTAKVTERLQVQTQVQNDAVFQTTASVGLVWAFGGPGGWSRGCRPLPERLDEPVVRETSVVVQQQERAISEVAIDPATGQPIVVKHARADAVPGGDGSFEHPFQTLGQLQAGSGPSQILFVQNGTYPGGITLQAGQRLLGDGIVHLVVARQGTFALPVIQAGAMPTITVSDQPTVGGIYPNNTAMVVLAANSEVSGLYFRPPPVGVLVHPGIYAAGITGALNVNRNHLLNIAALSDVTGPVSFTDNVSIAPDDAGTAYLSRITGPVIFSRNTIDTTFNTFLADIAGPLTYTDNTIRFFGLPALLSFSGANSTWTVRNNAFTGPGGDRAVSITANSGSLCVNLIGNSSNTGFGLGNLHFFASGNTGAITNIGGATQVSAPCP